MGKDLSIFYVADIHGSDRCFKKWLNAGAHYGVDVVIIGGDLTGKILVPVYRLNRGWSATWEGSHQTLETQAELDSFRDALRIQGVYVYETSPEEVAEIEGSIEVERAVFAGLKIRQLEEWIALADQRLTGTSIRAYVMPGNDDPPDVDPVLGSGRTVRNVADSVVEIGPGVYMASVGESTPTPWHTPRELDDDVLGAKIAQVVACLPARGATVWNCHMPPYDTGVDIVPKLDAELRVQYRAGQPETMPVGARSLRTLLAAHQPTLALHGHIHEGRGRYTMGRTIGFNPGSQYQDGVLLGLLLRVSADKGLRSYSFVAG